MGSAEELSAVRSQPDTGSIPPAHLRAFLVIGEDGSVRSVDQRAEGLLGYPADLLVGVNAFTFFHVDDVPSLLSIVSETLTRSSESRAVEVRVRREGDSWHTITLSATSDPAGQDAGSIAFRLHGPDQSVRATDQITRLTLRDHVTDLPNRVLFADRVDHAVARSSRRAQPVTVLVVGFSGYNTPGLTPHDDPEDDLVVAVARRLQSCVRTSDSVARLKNDEFGILLEDISTVSDVRIVVDRIVRTMDVPFFDGQTERTVVATIGSVTSTPERCNATELLAAATIARSWASVQGAGGYAEYDPTMSAPDDDDTPIRLQKPDTAFRAASDPADVTALLQRVTLLEQAVAGLQCQAGMTPR
jgi:diguanylate cyclase (GGDEF)-like protein/PAS domain S-box-containing protein